VLELRLLGPVGVSVNGAPVRLSSPRQRALLARLGLAEGDPVRVEHLIADLWGALPPRSAHNALQVLVSGLRSTLGRGAVLTGVQAYRLAEGAVVDAALFRDGVRRGLAASADGDPAAALRNLEGALMLWRSAALDGCDEVPFVETERAALEELYLAAAEHHAAARLVLGDPSGAVADLGMLVREHPQHEGLLAQLVLALGAAGRQVDALALFERARRDLVEQYGVEPGAQLRTAQERVLRGELPAQHHRRPAPLRLGLPELPPPLLGRDAETAALEAAVADPAVRLVTVLGLPGVGKTRLAESLVEAHPDRAALVPLAGVHRGEEVPGVVLARLGIDAGGADPAAALVDRFSDDERNLLLVLDGADHVDGIAVAIERMLRAVPSLTVVAASRTPLRLPAEHRLRIEGLAVRNERGSPGPAAALLLERIRRMDVGVRLSQADRDDAVAIAELCGGVPLALELAAQRAAVLGLPEVRRQLAWSLEVLTGPHGTGGRRSSMAEALLSAVGTLRPETAHTLRVIAGSPDPVPMDAARAMARLDALTVAEHVEELLDHGLLVPSTTDSGRRFALAPIVRRLFAPALREPVGVR
jgi:DNA-binding SARP family transcriptional activator